jgi:Mg2+/citrate symporter
MDAVQEALTLANDYSKQLITLAAAVLTLSATFQKDFDPKSKWWVKALAIGPSLLMFISIVCGLFAMGKLVTRALNYKSSDEVSKTLDDASGFAIPQIVLFGAGMGLILVYMVFSLTKKKRRDQSLEEEADGFRIEVSVKPPRSS